MFTREEMEANHTEILLWERNEGFLQACKKGDLKRAQALYTPSIVHYDDDAPFRWACANGHLSVVIWLLAQHPEIDHRMWDETPFITACRNNRVEVAIWLANYWKEVKLSDIYPKAFRRAMRVPLSVLKLAEFDEHKKLRHLKEWWTELSDDQKRVYYRIDPYAQREESLYHNEIGKDGSLVRVYNSQDIQTLITQSNTIWAEHEKRDEYGEVILTDPIVIKAKTFADAELEKYLEKKNRR